jgi:signal peptidase I
VSERARWFLRRAERGFAVIGLAMFLYHGGGFNLSVVSSHSMTPTLQGDTLFNGDVVLTERISYLYHKPRRWDVVMFHEEEFGSQVMKRVIGLPGETVVLRDKAQTILIDGNPVERPRSLRGIKYLAYGNLINGQSVPCGRGYFVLGDFSMDSQDSRWTGPIQPNQIRGRAALIVWPARRIGFVNR